MIIIDTALKAREAAGRPIRVGMIGAGFMAKGIANQLVNSTVGMRLSAIYARRPDQAVDVFRYASGALTPQAVSNDAALSDAIASGRPTGGLADPFFTYSALRRPSRPT